MPDKFIDEILKPLEAQGVNFELQDNELNSFDRYAYHLKLSMLDEFDSDFYQGELDFFERVRTNKIRSVVIAESGVTAGFNIIDCEITDALSSNFRTRTAITTEIKLTIVEPYSLTLPDKLYLAAEQLKVRSWRHATMVLEVWFMGYDEKSNTQDTKDKNNIYKVYAIIMTDFTSTLTETGTTYKISAVVDGDLGFRNAYYILPIGFTYDTGGAVRQVAPQGGAAPLNLAADTVGAFFAALETNLNDWYFQQRAQGRIQYSPGDSFPTDIVPVIVYKFAFTNEELINQRIRFTPDAVGRRLSFVGQRADRGVISISRGTSVSNIIDDVMASIQLEDGQSFFFTGNPDGTMRVPVVESRVVKIGWDGVLCEYIREITFFIGIRETSRIIPNPAYAELYQDLATGLGRTRLQSQAKLVKKVYPYYYTGNNTEILSLNVEFNNLHVIPIPYGDKTTLPPAILDAVQNIPQTVNELRARRSAAQQALQQAQRYRDQSAGLGPIEQQAAEAQYQRAILEYNIQANLLADAESRGIVEFYPDRNIISSRLPIDRQLQDAFNLEYQQYVLRLQQQQPRAFALDLYRDPAQQVRSASRLTFFADPRDITNYWTRSQGSNPVDSRQLYATMVSQIYDRIGDSMTQIDMEIRGDPWWMGPTNVERILYLDKVREVGYDQRLPIPDWQPSDSVANRYDQDVMFMLLFRAGVSSDEKTGYMKLNNNVEWFHALYIAIEVTHMFREGKFTQKIHAIREPINNLQAQGAGPLSAAQLVAQVVPGQGLSGGFDI